MNVWPPCFLPQPFHPPPFPTICTHNTRHIASIVVSYPIHSPTYSPRSRLAQTPAFQTPARAWLAATLQATPTFNTVGGRNLGCGKSFRRAGAWVPWRAPPAASVVKVCMLASLDIASFSHAVAGPSCECARHHHGRSRGRARSALPPRLEARGLLSLPFT